MSVSASAVNGSNQGVRSFPKGEHVRSTVRLQGEQLVSVVVIDQAVVIYYSASSNQVFVYVFLVRVPRQVSVFQVCSYPLCRMRVMSQATCLRLIRTASQRVLREGIHRLVLVVHRIRSRFPCPAILVGGHSIGGRFGAHVFWHSRIFIGETVSREEDCQAQVGRVFQAANGRIRQAKRAIIGREGVGTSVGIRIHFPFRV